MILTLLTTLIGVLVGALTTWYFSLRYYKKAGADLGNEAAKLRHLSSVMLNAMEDAGLVELNRNGKGEPIGRYIEPSVLFESRSTMSIG